MLRTNRRGGYGEEHFSLAGTYFKGNPPKSVNFYWRRFAIADMPLDDQEKFDEWVRARWVEKDALMEQYLTTGRFPANGAGIKGHIETTVRTQYWWDFLRIFVMLGAFTMVFNVLLRTLRSILRA
jgi:lysocardiolipin and lysophospholipid acyltransferase